MMNILTVNTGSSSVRLAVFEDQAGSIRKVSSQTFRTEERTPQECIQLFLAERDTGFFSAVAHRIVHGGTRFVESCLIDGDVLREIERLSVLAPLHNPLAVRWIEACRSVLGSDVPHVAVFDTAFFAAMPDVSKVYALPGSICTEHGIRRYGFHGIAHRAMFQRWKKVRPDLEKGGKLISLQLGSGCSITAVDKGQPVDTSMGFSPLEGLMMSTRCGDIDPGVLVYLQKSAGLSIDELDTVLNKSSGLSGVSAVSGDMKTVIGSEEPAARFAIELYCYRAKKYIGSYMAALGGVDGIVFGGGVGENAPLIRERILENMQWSGIDLDPGRNSDTIGTEGQISASSGRVDVRVLPVSESEILAQEAIDVLIGLKKYPG
jgi:acetate kinase